MATLVKSARILGTDRTRLTREISKQYANGASIRTLAGQYGRSYGFIHRLLTESDTVLRRRGGTARRPRTG